MPPGRRVQLDHEHADTRPGRPAEGLRRALGRALVPVFLEFFSWHACRRPLSLPASRRSRSVRRSRPQPIIPPPGSAARRGAGIGAGIGADAGAGIAPAVRRAHGEAQDVTSTHRNGDDLVRARFDPVPALFVRRELAESPLQLPLPRRDPREAAVRGREDRGADPPRRPREGLSVREGPVRDVQAGGTEGTRDGGDAGDRDRRIRAAGPGRAGVYREDVLPRARARGGQGLPPARGGDDEDGLGRAREVCGARQAVSRPGAAGRRSPRAGTTALRARGAGHRRRAVGRGRGRRCGTRPRRPVDRADRFGELRSVQVRG